MRLGPYQGEIRIEPGIRSSVRPGESLQIRVVKHLIDNKWAVSLRGRLFPAVSDLSLRPGQSLRVVAERGQQGLVLRVRHDPGSPARSLPAPLAAALARFAAQPEAATLELYQRLSKSTRIPRRKLAELIALAETKGIRAGLPVYERLLPVLAPEDYPEHKGRDHGRGRRRDLVHALRSRVEEEDSEDSLLGAFNALATGNENWVVVPFVFGMEGRELRGSIRFLLRGPTRAPAALVVETGGESRWSFRLDWSDRERRLRAFTNDPEGLSTSSVVRRTLQDRLRRFGISVDESVLDIEGFGAFGDPERSSGVDLRG